MIKRALVLQFEKQKIFILFVFSMIIFRATFSVIFGSSFFVNMLFLLGLVAAFFLFVLRVFFSGIYKRTFLIYLFVFWCLFLASIYGLTASVGGYAAAMIGIFNLCGLLVFYSSLYSCSKDKKLLFLFMKKTIVFFALINAIGAIFQYFISVDLFGLISNSVYTDNGVLERDNVTKRAVSFISSPQSLSLFMAFSFALVPSCINEKYMRLVMYLLFFISGVLTVSKAFVVFLIVYFVFSNFNYKRAGHFIVFVIFLVFVFFVFSVEGEFNRVFQLVYLLENYEKYSAYIIWKESIFYVDDVLSFFTGKGIGVFSRGGQELLNYSVLYGSTESFFIQVFVETGIVGFLIFISLVLYSYYRLLLIDKNLAYGLVSLCVIGLFSPAPYGFVCGMLMHFCLVSGVFLSPGHEE